MKGFGTDPGELGEKLGLRAASEKGDTVLNGEALANRSPAALPFAVDENGEVVSNKSFGLTSRFVARILTGRVLPGLPGAERFPLPDPDEVMKDAMECRRAVLTTAGAGHLAGTFGSSAPVGRSMTAGRGRAATLARRTTTAGVALRAKGAGE